VWTMIIVTGGAGFIGSALVWKLNQKRHDDIVVVDHFGTSTKWKNLVKRDVYDLIHKENFLQWLKDRPKKHGIQAIFHMGASSSTTETNMDYLVENNFHYSSELWSFCAKNQIPFIYASSASTYGAEEADFSDDPKKIPQCRPIHQYGFSKQIFDEWALKQKQTPPFWAGLKFFNVYGPQEYHKGSQASLVFGAFPQIQNTGVLKLFKSYRDGIKHGDQKRDFVYVKDVVDVLYHLHQVQRVAVSGIYNIGTGKTRTFADLGRAVFKAMGHKKENFEWIEMPEALKSQYQYYTQADLTLLRQRTGYKGKMTSLEDGVFDYVQNYLAKDDKYL
jgi:ADP-L-glycero-D-manno-heptose 6-epimerase